MILCDFDFDSLGYWAVTATDLAPFNTLIPKPCPKKGWRHFLALCVTGLSIRNVTEKIGL